MLNVYPIRLRFISARLLASVASIFKSAGCKGISFVAVKKLILNVSERTGMSVVPRRSDVFASQKLASRSVHGCTLLDRLFQKAYGRAFFRTDKDVREIKQQRVCPANSSLNSVHGCTLFNRLFQKAYGKCVFKSGGGVCIYSVLHKKENEFHHI